MAENREKSADNSAENLESEKEVVEKGVSGQVKWFNVKSGYGFVQRTDTNEDLFIHQSSIIKNNPKKARKSVGENENIEFDVAKGPKGYEAINVTGPNGSHVEGSRYARDLASPRRRFRNYSQSSGGRGGRPQRGRRPMGRPPYMVNYHPYYGDHYEHPGYPSPDGRMIYFRPTGPPQRKYMPSGPGGYYFRGEPQEMRPRGGYRGGRRPPGPMGGYRGGRGGRQGNRSRERADSANMNPAGDQTDVGRGRGKRRSGRQKRKSTNKSESENEKNVNGISSGMAKMDLNGPEVIPSKA